jgi:RNA polymerase sigma factor (TIGR02999 family)
LTIFSPVKEEITRMITAIEDGDPRAAEELLPLVYTELRRLAASQMASLQGDQTLQPTALVHEAFIRLTADPDKEWNGRTHFFRASAKAMQRILIDSIRRKGRQKHGGGMHREVLDDSKIAFSMPSDQLIALDEALELLDRKDTQSADIVRLRYFVGMTMAEAAAALGISVRGAERRWAYARAWLHKELSA